MNAGTCKPSSIIRKTNAFEIWLCEIRQKFTFTQYKQQSLTWEETFAKKKKRKKNSLNIWIIIQLTSSTLCLPDKRTYQFGGNWPSFSSLAPYNRRRRKMELGYKHIYDMSSKTEHWKVSDFMKKKTKHEHLQSSKTQTKERDR